MYVIGTAGHVDHGKSLLVEALTGIDPDQLREEKERGLTIDLGFAWLTLPSGRELSIVDVPGHERFIKNMLAGAGGIDLALLVIAADEGVMPQTREHLAILDLLGVRSGVLVLTKRDLVDDEMLELVSNDVREVVSGTTLEGSPLVACSARTGEGLDELRRVLDERLSATAPKRDIGRPRLPVDRSFTIKGFGTVVTGTLLDGVFEVGQEVAIVPDGPSGRPDGRPAGRIRGLQNHQQQVERALPGTRTAVNVSGVAKEDVRRGQVLALPGSLTPTNALDVRLRALASLRRPLRHDAELTLHVGSAEVAARLLLLDRAELTPGDECWAQLRLAEPVAVVRGDRFVLRTPNDTVGGGEIVDVHPKRHRRSHAPTLEALDALSGGSTEEALLAALRRVEPAALADAAGEIDASVEELRSAADALARDGRVVVLGEALMSAEGFAALSERARAAVEAYHSEHPLRRGVPKEELRGRLRLDERAFVVALGRWGDEGVLSERGGVVALAGYEPALTARQRSEVEAYVAALAASPYAPPTDVAPAPELLAYLEESGRVVSVGDGVVFASEAYRAMVERVTEHLRREGSITLAQARDLFGTSRKYAQALLEHLDRRRVTRRVGDERRLVEGG
ncbi:MAG: selenocysteine-specific translation elongation factor [Dehalococcoidia bacterium]